MDYSTATCYILLPKLASFAHSLFKNVLGNFWVQNTAHLLAKLATINLNVTLTFGLGYCLCEPTCNHQCLIRPRCQQQRPSSCAEADQWRGSRFDKKSKIIREKYLCVEVWKYVHITERLLLCLVSEFFHGPKATQPTSKQSRSLESAFSYLIICINICTRKNVEISIRCN